MASDRKWYPPELHPDVIGRWWEHPVGGTSAPTPPAAPGGTAVLTRPAVHIASTAPSLSVRDHSAGPEEHDALSALRAPDSPSAPGAPHAPPTGPAPVVRRPDGDIIDLTRPYPHYPAVSGPVTAPVSAGTAFPDIDPFPPLDEPVWADSPSTPAVAPTARTTIGHRAPSTRPTPPPEPGVLRRAVAKAPVASGALAAVTIAAVGIGGVALMAQAQGSTRDSASPEPVSGPTLVSVYELGTDMCVGLDGDDGAISAVLTVPCSSTHTHRVAAMIAVGTAGGAYDPELVLQQATESCGNELAAQGLVDTAYVIIQPSPASWDDGDRRAICLVEEGTE